LAFLCATLSSSLLAPPIIGLLAYQKAVLEASNRILRNMATYDFLTGTLNRRAFGTRIDTHLHRVAEGREAAGALLALDADHFKQINDRFGHDKGDEALRLMVRTIEAELRPGDLFGRIGGEEFAIYLTAADRRLALAIAERIRAGVEATPFFPDGAPHGLSISIGMSRVRRGCTFQTLLAAADRQLYIAKRAGRNRVAPASDATGGSLPPRQRDAA